MGEVHLNRDSRGRFIKGHKPTPEMIEKDRLYHLGKKHTKATKEKISKNRKGKRAWNKGIPSFKTRGEKHPLWGGGKTLSKEGYVYIYSPDHPYRNKRNYVLEHRLVMEKYLGRFLNLDEVIHHINKIKNDNRLENLELMKNQSEHMLSHDAKRVRNRAGMYI